MSAPDLKVPGVTPGLTIRSIRCRAVVAPLPVPLVTKVLVINEAPLLLVDLLTDEGITGRCYLFAFSRAGCRHLTSVIEDLGQRNQGKELAPVSLYDANVKGMTLFGHQGIAAMAVAAFDMCCWDAAAKAAAMPLARYLGGSLEPVKAYNSNGLGLAEPEVLGEEAQRLLAAGDFKAVKLRLGRDDPAEDVRAVRTVRAAVGDAVDLPADFNQGLNVEQAIARGRVLDDEGLYWVEEPVPYDDLAGQARIAAALRTPVQIGENLYGPRMVADAIAAGAADYLMFDLMRIGGVTGWLRAAALAEAAAIPVSSHLFTEFSAHLMSVTPTAHWLEYMSWGDAVLEAPVAVNDGMICPSPAPGAGITWNEEGILRYALS